MDKITKEEYAEAIEWANRPTDETATREKKEIVARVLLALAGFYNDTVAGMRNRKDHDGLRDIESGYGLPVGGAMEYDMNKPCPHCGGDPKVRNPTGECDHLYFPEQVNKNLEPKPCPECGGSGSVAGWEHEPGCGGNCKRCPIEVELPCPACQGEGR